MIEFVRGDTQPLKFKIIKKDGTQPLMEEIQTLIMTCRKTNNLNSKILFQKTKDDFNINNEYFHIVINPEDTQELDYGLYNFDIECTLTNGYKKTLKATFEITEEDTIYEA